MANYTKKVLSFTLQELMKEKPLNDITVHELVEKSSMNRKTFYYHFHNIADLLKWTLYDNFLQLRQNPLSTKTWTEHTKSLLCFISDHKYFFHSMRYSKYYAEMHLYLKELMSGLFQEYEKETWKIFEEKYHPSSPLKESHRNYIIKYFSGALFTLIDEWFLTGMQESIDHFTDILKLLISDSICNAYLAFCQS